MEALPDELLVEIFRWLRKKPSYRCKCVSKRWRDLISDIWRNGDKFKLFNSGCFIQEKADIEEDLYGDTDYSVLFFRLDDKGEMTPEESLDFTEWTHSKMLGSCNGLLFYCLKSAGKMQYGVADPVTRESVLLPLYPGSRLASISKSPAALGFVFDSETGHWKLIAVYFYNRRNRIGVGVMIFDSEAGEWRTKAARFSDDSAPIQPKFVPDSSYLEASAIYLDGALHWVSLEYLVMFFLETGIFRVIRLPETLNYYKGLAWESEGRFYYCQLCQILGLCIWVLDADSSWRKTFCDPVPSFLSKLPDWFSSDEDDEFGDQCGQVLCFFEELHIIYLFLDDKLVCYHIAERMITPVEHPTSLELYSEVSSMRHFLTEWTFNVSNGRAKLPDCGTKRRLADDDKSGKEVVSIEMFRELSTQLDETDEQISQLEENLCQREAELCLLEKKLQELEESLEALNNIRSSSSLGFTKREFIGETQLDTTSDRGLVLDKMFHGHHGGYERGQGSGWSQGKCSVSASSTEMYRELSRREADTQERMTRWHKVEHKFLLPGSMILTLMLLRECAECIRWMNN
ncbi:hypothetical protein H6P81_011457 [Aristolochia fimbriata]|uniref:F-box domain-containing protein n=1 Tax=Aristolochia fimbriata TaxID=158543 RepID=A0AAV7ERJ0_ARIFI|nr:hypothetical protein H6P81_011457 [Aristolochia fimbriata]